MIAVDASAVLAIHLGELERAEFTAKILRSQSAISPVNLWEVLVRADAIDGEAGRRKAEQLVEWLGIEAAPIDMETTRLAVDAFARYGKRTPAKLNLGDCFAYALAKQRDTPLLYKGDDFAKTDITAA